MTLKFRYRFEAAHRFVGASSPECQTPHGHTWHATLEFAPSTQQLNASNMVDEFKQVKKLWREFIQQTVDHSFLLNHDDPIREALEKTIPGVRLLLFPGDPTTEMIAVLFLRKAQAWTDAQGTLAAKPVAILIEETPVNSIYLNVRDELFQQTAAHLDSHCTGWWNEYEPTARKINKI